MAVSFKDVTLHTLPSSSNKNVGDEVDEGVKTPMIIQLLDEQENLLLRFKETESSPPLTNLSIELYKDSETARFGDKKYVIRDETAGSGSPATTQILQFDREADVIKFADIIRKFKQGNKDSVFAQRTDDSSASQYFQFYGYLSQQQNMMQDYIRTSTYQKAILNNSIDFKDKIILDVGAGSGILSFFAVQAGAKKVYAVEASSMAKHAEALVYSNKLHGKITVIPGKIEEITIPEPVDVIISEPMGYMLFNERMLETYLHAKKWMKPGGKMFPSRGDLHLAPFQDSALYMEQLNKANFWYQEHFHGVDLSALRTAAVQEYFRQPIVDTFDVRICTAKSFKYSVDFEQVHESDLHKINIPFSFTITTPGEIHGLAFWFDVAFTGSQQTVWLSTAPTQPLTHWYQVRCLIHRPLFLERGQILTGHVTLISNKRQSYDVEMKLIPPNGGFAIENTLDLKNPYFRYTGQAPQPPPGVQETSPSEQYWTQMDCTTSNHVNGTVVMNGSNGSSNHSNLIDVSQFVQQHQGGGNNQVMVPGHNGQGAVGPYSIVVAGAAAGGATSPAAGASSSTARNIITGSGVVPQIPCSLPGGGISPSLFLNRQHASSSSDVHQQQQQIMFHQQQQQPGVVSPSSAVIFNQSNTNFPVSNNLMIGDYAAAAGPPQHMIHSQQQQPQQQHPLQHQNIHPSQQQHLQQQHQQQHLQQQQVHPTHTHHPQQQQPPAGHLRQHL